MKLKKNEVYTVEIESLTNLGFGVCRISGCVVFVSGAVAGDVVECRIIKVGTSYSVGKIERVISRSDKYTEGRCDGTCHSCAYKHISYAAELGIKTEQVIHDMKKAGLSHIRVNDTVASPKLCEYRNKAQYPLMNTKNGIAVGFFAPKSHRVTEAADCPLSPAVFSEIIAVIREFLQKNEIPAYDEESGGGLVRHIYLRRGEISGEILLTLVINGKSLPHADKLVSSLTADFADIVGILLNKNTKNTNVILSDDYETLFGRDYIYDTLAGVRLKISAPSFYQVNHSTAELLYAEVAKLADPKPTDTVLDLYCGAGSIGLSLAKRAGEVIGIEIVADAVKCAKENAEANEIKNARFFTGDAANTENLLTRAESELGRKIEPDVIILDPPRAGCDAALLDYAAKLNPEKIVYVSCNPATLARDIAYLRPLGYDTTSLTPFDMFPMTGHVESVVCLTRTFNN